MHTHKTLIVTHIYTGLGILMNPKGTLSSHSPPCYIVMPNFSQHKRDGDLWFSQPFYSEPGGYKLCLRVDANGSASAHISVYVNLMKGENDDHLQWPFEHDVTYGILNWKRDENHVIKTLHFKNAPIECKQRVASIQQTQGWGFISFLPHTSLSDGDATVKMYIFQDCLCLQVLKVKPPK